MYPADDKDLLAYFDHCVDVCASEFRRTRESLPPRFRVAGGGVMPEFRMDPGGGPGTIILERGGDFWRERFQAGHEVFHWLITRASAYPGIHHWTHEMFANEMGVRCLRASGIRDAEAMAEEYAKWLESKSEETTLLKMLTTPLTPPYEWVFGRAFVIGRKLQKAVSWERLKPLATAEPDIRSWLEALPAKLRRAANEVLGEPSDEWV